jgi:hypothetical protein
VEGIATGFSSYILEVMSVKGVESRFEIRITLFLSTLQYRLGEGG